MPTSEIEQFISDSLNRATRLDPLHAKIRGFMAPKNRKHCIMMARERGEVTSDEATMLLQAYQLETA